MFWEIVLILVILVVGFYVFVMIRDGQKMMEGYYGDSGQFAFTCSGRTPNSCLSTFNCGMCFDRYGNYDCKGGDVHGPFNYDGCSYWSHGDPYSKMIQRNSNYSCAMGPRSSNRLIGV